MICDILSLIAPPSAAVIQPHLVNNGKFLAVSGELPASVK